MEENNFEKQVQQKMSGLKIAPSDAVWDHVKINIEKRKDRRWLLLFFFFGFIALLSGLYYFSTKNYSPAKSELAGDTASIDSAPSFSANKKNTSEKKNNLSEETLAKRLIANSKNENDNHDTNIFKKESHANKKIITPTQHNNANLVATITSQRDGLHVAHQNNSDDSAEINSFVINDHTNKKVDLDSLKNDTSKNVTITDTLTNITAAQIEKQIDSSTQKSKNKKSVIAISKKWNIGFLLAGGISHVGNQFLGLGYVSADYSQNASSAPPGNVSLSNPSKVKNGLGFIAGVFFEKAISSKTGFSFGINYKEFNTSNLVGRKNDSAATYSFANANKQYNNNFKFIELPLKVRVELGHNKSFPVFWSGGITLSQLIKSNALQFDPYASSIDPFAKAYFTDNSFFNKTSLGLNTSFSTTIFSIKKNTILAGPYFYYATTKLANEGLYSKKHFVFLGLQTQIIFNKK